MRAEKKVVYHGGLTLLLVKGFKQVRPESGVGKSMEAEITMITYDSFFLF